MVGAYLLVSLTIWIVARFSPHEWHEPELCDECLIKRISAADDDFDYEYDDDIGDKHDDQHSGSSGNASGHLVDKMRINMNSTHNLTPMTCN